MATIVLPAEKVIEAAEKTIKDIKTKRLTDNAVMVSNYIKKNTPGKFFAKLGFKAPTEEQAISELIQDIWGSYPSEYAWRDYSSAKKLLKLAQHGDPVTLNEEDVRVLF